MKSTPIFGSFSLQATIQLQLLLLGSCKWYSESFSIAYFQLINFPEEQEKLYQEVATVIGDREIKWQDLKELKLMTYFIQECLRLFPPVGKILASQ